MISIKNTERIIELALLQGIYTPTEIENMIKKGIEIPLHTKNRWLEKGKKVREDMEDKGYDTKLWIKSKDDDKYYLVDVKLYSEEMLQSS